jgi:ATP-dependent DNA helicase PIF1
LRRNLDLKRGLSNGALGTLTEVRKNLNGKITCLEILFYHLENPEPIKTVSATFNITPNVRLRRMQFPVSVCFGMTIHRCQGMTCDNILIDLTRCFSTGMGYVALSRTRNLEGIHLINFHIDSINCSKEAVAEYNRLRSLINLPPLPQCNVKPPIAKLFGKLPKSVMFKKNRLYFMIP